MNTLTLISGQWMPSRLRFPLLFLLPLLLLAPALTGDARFLPLAPVTQQPLASEFPLEAAAAEVDANRVATDRYFPLMSDELEVRRQLADGTLPTWDPRQGLGGPLAGGSLSTPWNPLRWPFLVLAPEVASGWHALLTLVLGGLGMLLFLEGRGLKFTAAFLGVLAFQASGYLVANLHYVMKVDALVWAPWCLWGVDLLFRGRRNAGLMITAGLGLSALAGFPPVFLFVAALCLAWILVRALEAIRVQAETPFWKRSLGTALLFFGLGLCGGGAQLLPMAEAAAHSTRGPEEPAAIAAQSLPAAALATSVLPTLFGLPTDARPASSDPITWWLLGVEDVERGLAANRLEWNLFAGITVLAFVASALLSRPRQALFPLAALACAWGLAFDIPGLQFLYGLPGTNLGHPARAAAIGALALAWLAALGFDALLEGWRSARLGALGVAFAGLVLGLGLWFVVEPSSFSEHLDATLPERFGVDLETVRGFFSPADAEQAAARVADAGLTLALFSALLLLIAYFAGRLTVRGGGVAICLLLVVEATVAGQPHTTPAYPGALPVFPASEAMDAIAATAGDGRLVRIDNSPSGVGDVLRLARPNLPSVYGVADLTPYVAFPSKRLAELWRELDADGLYRGAPARITDPALLERPLFDALRVRCVLATQPLDSPFLAQRYAADEFYVYERTGALEVARVVPQLVPEDEGTLARLAAPDHDFAAAAFGPRAASPYDESPFEAGTLQLRRPSASRVDIGVVGTSGGFLVVHEGWMPGWKATVNGRDAEVLRLDHVYFGVQVPPGNSTVRLKYEPWSLRIGTLLSLIGLSGALLLTRWRHGRPRPEAQAHARTTAR